jgi:hypothetical protein
MKDLKHSVGSINPVIHFLSAYITLRKLGPNLSPYIYFQSNIPAPKSLYITFKSNIQAPKSPYITLKSNIRAQKWTQIGSNIRTQKMYHWERYTKTL